MNKILEDLTEILDKVKFVVMAIYEDYGFGMLILIFIAISTVFSIIEDGGWSADIGVILLLIMIKSIKRVSNKVIATRDEDIDECYKEIVKK